MRPVYIYFLIDPITEEIRYVGKSVVPNQRYRQHCSGKGKTHCARWVRKLKSVNLKPRMQIVEIVPAGRDWEEAEQRWIAYGRSMGWKLTNATDGGGGMVGHQLSHQTKLKIGDANRGRKLPPVSGEYRQKMSVIKKGHPVSAETRQKISSAQIGKKKPWATWNRGRKASLETRKKLSLSHLGQEAWNKGQSPSEETRRKIAETLAGKKLPSFSDDHKQKISESIKRHWETRRKKNNEP